jgi:hypothetical protein
VGDPFAAVSGLAGVGSAAAHARDAIDVLLRHPAVRRDAGRVAAQVAVRCSRSSAALELGFAGDERRTADLPGTDPVLQGALRVAGALPTLAAVWSRSPAQALARLHVLAARDLLAAGSSAGSDPASAPGADGLGRPRPGVDRDRLDQILALATAPTAAPGVVVAAIVHAELLALAPFGTADGVVARAAERLVLVERGVDPRAVCATETGHATTASYGAALGDYAAGAVASWVRRACDAYARGAEESLLVCERLAA